MIIQKVATRLFLNADMKYKVNISNTHYICNWQLLYYCWKSF